jgi:hypothetical protein
MPKLASPQTGRSFAQERGTIFAGMTTLTTKRTFLAVLFLGLFAMACCNVDDPDVWWHLKAGEYIAAHQRVPRADPFSYTRAGQPWVAHEWLTELALYELCRVTGFAGLILAFAAILAGAFVLLYLRCAAAPYIAGCLALWAALATRPVWGVRPQVISLFLVSLWLLLLERADKNPKLLWWTVPLTLLWVNLHAGFALGLAVYAVFLLGALIEHAFRYRAPNPPWRLSFVVFGIDLLLVPLNPSGLRLYSYPFETLRSAAMQTYIAEWASPNFHRAEYWPFLLLVLAIFAALAYVQIPVRSRDLLLLLASFFASLESIRMIPFFVLIAIPMLSHRLRTWPLTHHRSARTRPQTVLNTTIILAMIAFAAIHVTQVINRQPAVEAQEFPARAVAFLIAHPTNGRIFNDYDWGGYLIWKLPSIQVFIDGRADLYGKGLFDNFANAYQFKDGWQQILERWQVQTVIVPSNSALATGLRNNHVWNITYRDSQATILTASAETP